MMRLTRGKSEEKPRYQPPAQTGRKLNPIFARILKISQRVGMPIHYKRDLVIDRNAINRKHPSAVLWGVRDYGTDIICLSKGKRKTVPQGGRLFGQKEVGYYEIGRGHIEYPNGDIWYYVTPSGDRRVSKEDALKILRKYAGRWSGF